MAPNLTEAVNRDLLDPSNGPRIWSTMGSARWKSKRRLSYSFRSGPVRRGELRMRWRIERQLLRVNPHAVATCRHAIASIDTSTITATLPRRTSNKGKGIAVARVIAL